MRRRRAAEQGWVGRSVSEEELYLRTRVPGPGWSGDGTYLNHVMQRL